jgi:glucose-1-phosphate thymidylyltransferase
VLSQPKNQGEYFLTDAFQYMIDKGARIQVIDVDGWYDAGKIDTLLDTNRVMLEKGRARIPSGIDRSQVIEPVYIEDGVKIANSKVGPNVSLGAGTIIEHSTVRDTIAGNACRIVRSKLINSLIGDEVLVAGVQGEVTLGDHSEVRANEE